MNSQHHVRNLQGITGLLLQMNKHSKLHPHAILYPHSNNFLAPTWRTAGPRLYNLVWPPQRSLQEWSQVCLQCRALPIMQCLVRPVERLSRRPAPPILHTLRLEDW